VRGKCRSGAAATRNFWADGHNIARELAGMKLGRNDPCSCGSGKKYKNCCQGKLEPLPPRSAPSPVNLGSLDALFFSGQYAALEDSANTLLETHPDVGGIWKLLGLSLQMQGKDALAAMQKAAELMPTDAETHANLAALLRSRGQLEAAIASGARALKIHPNFPEAHNNQGVALKELGQLEAALLHYRKAVELKPDFAEAHNNLGIALKELGRLENAIASYRRALEIKPDFVDAHNNLGNALLATMQIEEAAASYRRATALNPDYFMAQGNLLSCLNYARHPADYRLEEARKYGRMVAKKAATTFSTWRCEVQPERLRVGFVSGSLRNSPTGFFLESTLAQLARSSIELIAYPSNLKEDELTGRIKPYFREWKPIANKSDEAAAQLVRADGVHVLIDLAGHSAYNRLPMFAWRPAPVQVSWLDSFATTGVAEMDYFMADEAGVPESHRSHFSEKVWYLPDTRLCFTAPDLELPVARLPALRKGHITFGCFQILSKLNDEVLAAYGKILGSLPGAKIRFQCGPLGDAKVAVQFARRLQQHGIEAARITLHGPEPRQTYLASYGEVDLILDTFPFPGGTTTCDAIWMGVPTITLNGDSLLSRQGASLLAAAGLKDWIAVDVEEYVSKVLKYAEDLPGLAALRAGLRQQASGSPLFDAQRFARNFEIALWGMWRIRSPEVL
jgi:predicted O-linked N-acetylglucosamine transferase (SPINDLY family)